MGRPSKLTEAEWLDVERRHLSGASLRQLARDFGVSPGRISERISKRVTIQKALANQIADAEMSLSSLPVSEQVAVRALADELKSISVNLAGAARLGSMTARQLAEVAHAQARKIKTHDGADPEANSTALKSTVALTMAANEAAKMGLSLLSAVNKDAAREQPVPAGEAKSLTDLSHLSDAELMALVAAGDAA